jgi:hypothetical protein
MSEDRIVIPIENDFGRGIAVVSRKLVEKLMSEERKEFDLNVVGWYCLFFDGKPFAVFARPSEAAEYVQMMVRLTGADHSLYEVKLITRKTPFTE